MNGIILASINIFAADLHRITTFTLHENHMKEWSCRTSFTASRQGAVSWFFQAGDAFGVLPPSAVERRSLRPGWSAAQMQRSLTISLFSCDCTWRRRAIKKTMWHEHNSSSQQIMLALWSEGWWTRRWQVFCSFLLRCRCAVEQISKDKNALSSRKFYCTVNAALSKWTSS